MTEKPWLLTPDAEEAFLNIGEWTCKTFGSHQAEAYMGELIDTCRRIAAGTAISKDCRSMFDPNLPEDLRFVRCGQHFIVYIDEPESVSILGIMHSRSDLPGKLANLFDPKRYRNH